ncbi:MAG TPA: vitamin K epoxide reductase family protein [Nitrospiria bacterium]|jgi:uncharacterized membrane protein
MKLAPPPKWIIGLFLLISFMGFGDSTYLAAKHYLGTPLNCSVFTGCEDVTSSPYATILGVPLGVYGGAYYLGIFLFVIGFIDTKNNIFLLAAVIMTPFGFAASVWFVYLQYFVLQAICPYCMVSAGASTLLLVLGLLVFINSGKREST